MPEAGNPQCNYRALLMSCQPQDETQWSKCNAWDLLREVPELRRVWEMWVQLLHLPLSSAVSQSNPLPRSRQHLYPKPKFLMSSSLSQAPEEAPSKSFRSVPHPPAFPFQIYSPQLLQEAQLAQLRRKHGQSILGTSLGNLTLYKC